MTAISPDPAPLDLTRWPDLRPARANVRGRVERGLARAIFLGAVRRLKVRVELPDGRAVGAGGPGAPTMVLRRPEAFFQRVGADGLIGFGESYMAGDWEADDLGAFLTVLAERISTLVPAPLQHLRALYVARHPESERNTTEQTRGNIARHYDLSNDMFATFLDETMTYSSALFEAPIAAGRAGASAGPGAASGTVAQAQDPGRPTQEVFAEAQRRKIDRLLDAAGVGEGTRVLEIGTGWGELSLRAAARGAIVRSITLSTEQQTLARERVAAAGLSDRVDIDLCDYRLVEGTYDAVVSIEMIEAVGFEYMSSYFRTIDSVLAPGGKVAIQAITMGHDRMLTTRDTYTWIHKYIFPGGFLPSVEQIHRITSEETSLRVTDRLSMGLHYAQTLRLWDETFRASRPRIVELGFDSVFERMWHFYLEYCRAGFAAEYIDVNQLTFTKGATA